MVIILGTQKERKKTFYEKNQILEQILQQKKVNRNGEQGKDGL